MKLMDEFIASQQRCPKGLVGRIIAERMVCQHQKETQWAVSLLEIKATDRVLEIGFGAGKAIEHIASLTTTGYVAGIDLSPTMVQVASRRNAQAIKAKRVALQSGDVTTLPFTDQQFDKVLSIHTFYFWPDHLRGMTEIFRVLKLGGTLALTLSTGKVGEPEGTGLAIYQTILEEKVLPGMKEIGFTTAYIKQGPLSRQFKTVAVIGIK
jgi:ubiquinone/menaquinone biosynthesis C-methylase UbiE